MYGWIFTQPFTPKGTVIRPITTRSSGGVAPLLLRRGGGRCGLLLLAKLLDEARGGVRKDRALRLPVREPRAVDAQRLLALRGLRVVEAEALAAKLAGCEDRDAAALFRGRDVAIPREAFPAAGENEFYWADLIGLEVVNEQDEKLGRVTEVFETGASDVLVVQGRDGEAEKERLIPFLESVVRKVDLPGRVIRVDWGLDY